MKSKIFLAAFFLALISINFISAENFGYNFLESGSDLNLGTNFSIQNVNSSDFWDLLDTPADINTADLNDDGTYWKSDGSSTATGNWNLNNYNFSGGTLTINIDKEDNPLVLRGKTGATSVEDRGGYTEWQHGNSIAEDSVAVGYTYASSPYYLIFDTNKQSSALDKGNAWISFTGSASFQNLTASLYSGDGSNLTNIPMSYDSNLAWENDTNTFTPAQTFSNNITLSGTGNIVGKYFGAVWNNDDLVTNGGFTGNANGWSFDGTYWFYDTNNMGFDSDFETVDEILQQDIGIESGNTYNLTYTISNWYRDGESDTILSINFCGVSVASYDSSSSPNGVHSHSVTCSSTANLTFNAYVSTADVNTILQFNLDDVSVSTLNRSDGVFVNIFDNILLASGGDIYYQSSVYDKEKYGDPLQYFQDVDDYTSITLDNKKTMNHENRADFLKKIITLDDGSKEIIEPLDKWKGWIEQSIYKIILRITNVEDKINDLESEVDNLKNTLCSYHPEDELCI